MTNKKTSGEIGDEVTEIAGAAKRASSPVRRALAEMEPLVYPGAREVATLTVAARSLDWQFEPVMQALQTASKITDWSHPFMVAQPVKGDRFGPRFNWKDAPYRHYKSFEHFYAVELERTFGTWESLQHTWAEVVKGKITEDAARRQIEERATRAREVDAADQANPSRQGQRTDRTRDAEPAAPGDLFDNNKNGVQEVKAPTGNAVAAALRRLRKDRPDIHQRVLAGEITAHAGMIEAGFRKKRTSQKLTLVERALKLWAKMSDDERAKFRAVIASSRKF